MNRAKQLKNKIENNLPEIVFLTMAAITAASLAHAAQTNSKLERVRGSLVVGVERTPADEILLFLNKGGYLIAKIEDIPLITKN